MCDNDRIAKRIARESVWPLLFQVVADEYDTRLSAVQGAGRAGMSERLNRNILESVARFGPVARCRASRTHLAGRVHQ